MIADLSRRRKPWSADASVVAFFSIFGAGLLVLGTRTTAGSWQLAIVLAAVAPAFALAVVGSSALLPYVAGMYAFSALFRRLSDYEQGAYSSVSVISIIPILSSLALLASCFRGSFRFPPKVLWALGLYAGFVVLALAVGVERTGPGALFEAADYLVPLLPVLYCAVRGPSKEECDTTLRAFVWICAVVAVYGWIQFLVMPAWDSFWMRNGIAMASNGQPYPYKVRVFSTMNSPGSWAGFLTLGLVASLLDRRWRGPLGWVGVFLLFSAFCITFVRASWIAALGMLVVFVLAAQKNRLKTLAGIAAFLIVGVLAAPALPGGAQIEKRVASFQRGNADFSFRRRAEFTLNVLSRTLRSPLGAGLGASGISSKLSNGGQLGEFGIFDNGYLNLAFTFGVVPAAFLVVLIILLAGQAFRSAQEHPDDEGRFARLAVSSLAASLLMLLFFNCQTGVQGFTLWLPFALWIGSKKASSHLETVAA